MLVSTVDTTDLGPELHDIQDQHDYRARVRSRTESRRPQDRHLEVEEERSEFAFVDSPVSLQVDGSSRRQVRWLL